MLHTRYYIYLYIWHMKTEERIAELLKSVHIMGVCAEIMDIEYHNELVDTRFKQPSINQRRKRIIDDIKAIRSSLNNPNNIFNIKDKEHMQYDYAVEIHKIVEHFSLLGLEAIKEFNKGIDEINRNRKAEEINS